MKDFGFEEMWTIAGALQYARPSVAFEALTKLGLTMEEAHSVIFQFPKTMYKGFPCLFADRRSIAMAIIDARATSHVIEKKGQRVSTFFEGRNYELASEHGG